MSVEMKSFSIHETKNGTIYGSFILKKYKEIRIEFQFKNGEISYYYAVGDIKKIDSFHQWLSKEKDIYTPFVLNYVKEIEHFNNFPFSKGEIVQETSLEILGTQCYAIIIQYKELPDTVVFRFYPSRGEHNILYQFPIVINSDGEYSTAVHLQDVLKKETIQRIWEPFRSKTKYRLELLHMLR